MQSVVSDLSCRITVKSHCLQSTVQEGMRAWMREPDWGHLNFPTVSVGILQAKHQRPEGPWGFTISSAEEAHGWK